VHHIGENGMGSSFKIINNMLTGQALLAFAETLALGQALGIQRERMLDIFIGGPLVAPLVAGKRAKIETGIYDPEFPLQWMQKDLQLASQTAYEVGLPLPLVNLAKEVYMQAVQAGLGEDDFSAVYEIVNRKAR
jgi:3-hydroxyisobutyrate dehydrogenase-like beta-hydroxyacid dehydrogenase